MLANLQLVGFVPITDAERARRFYVGVLKLEFVTDDGFAVVLRGGGAIIRLFKLKEFTPAGFTVLGWETPDIVRTVEELTQAGVIFQRYSFLQQDERGIWYSPDGSAVAWFADPEGNSLSISQHAALPRA